MFFGNPWKKAEKLKQLEDKLYQMRVDSIPASVRPLTVHPDERRVQIAAAKARMTIDRQLKVETPDWIIALSKEKPYA